jgi:rhodanese-related sulfurtransferase
LGGAYSGFFQTNQKGEFVMRNDRPLRARIGVGWVTLIAAISVLVLLHSSKSDSHENVLPSSHVSQLLPAENQTSRNLTAREAYAKWKAESEAPIIVDVRTPEEFLFVGHAAMAWNVPVAAQTYVWDSATGQFPMRPLPDFVSRVEQIAQHDDTLLVMCRSGGRSVQAVDLLTRAGFSNVYNIMDGMEGDLVNDPNSVFNGQRMVNGWKNSGLPWTYDVDPKRMILPRSP